MARSATEQRLQFNSCPWPPYFPRSLLQSHEPCLSALVCYLLLYNSLRSHVVILYEGYYHSCSVDSLARMFCWGDGSSGRLGQNCSMGSDDSFNLFRSHTIVVAQTVAVSYESQICSGSNLALGFESAASSDSLFGCNGHPNGPSRTLIKSFA